MALWEWIVLGGLGIALKNDISKTAEQRRREEREMQEIDDWLEKLDKECRQAEKKRKKEQKRITRQEKRDVRNSRYARNGSNIQPSSYSSAKQTMHGSESAKIPSVTNARENTPCKFQDGITQAEFKEIALMVGSQFNRIIGVSVEGATVVGTVESQTKQSNWKFSASFNNWGHITGRRWIWSENDKSNIPQYFAEALSSEIKYLLEKRNIHLMDYAEIINDNPSLQTEDDLTFCRRVGFFQRIFSCEPQVKLEIDVQKMIGEHLYLVISILKQNGFTNIKSIPIYDVGEESNHFIFEVGQIVIDERDSHASGVCFRESCEVIINYHAKLKIQVPFNARQCKKSNYLKVGDELQRMGFSEIYERPIRDLTTGWIKPDGSIERITIAGNSDFKKNDVFTYDEKIVIEYHTYKSAKQE